VLFTSGTTAEPKGVVLRHANLFSYVTSTVEFGHAEPTDAAIVSVPPYHVAGVGSVLTNVYAGRRLVYLDDFTPKRWLALVREQGVTQAMLVPTMLARIVDHLGDQVADVPSLRSIAYGGAATPRPVLERALRSFPGVGFTNSYGLTETSSTVAVLGPDDHRLAVAATDPRVRERLGSVGRPVPGMELAVRDALGHDLPTGEEGELWLRGAQVSGEYLGELGAGPDDGWFATRDRAWIDAGGYLYILGRLDDTIIRGGENIAPAEIEAVLLEHPSVRDVAVVGLPDDEWGQCTVAAVSVAAGADLTEEDVRIWARGRLRGSRTPDRVVFRAELPYNPMGKLLRRQLVAELLQKAG
jgi:acyl-CoA synthetase (AMP-forming)/AMP-acid ligase II